MEDAPKTYIQKAHKKEIRVSFLEDKLDYAMRDQSGEREFSVFYESINLNDPSMMLVKDAQRSRRLFYFISLVILSVAFLSLHDQSEGDLQSLYLALALLSVSAGFAVNLFMQRKSIRYKIFQTSNKGPLHFIQNEDYPSIEKEITDRWVTRAKKLYGTINFLNDFNKEQQKFEWLKHNNVITEEEYKDVLTKLRTAHLSQQTKLRDDGTEKPTSIN